VRIACRDLQKVPATAKGSLGLCIHDFGFEREVQEENTVKTLTSGIKVGQQEPPRKKLKADDKAKPVLQLGSSNQSDPKISEANSSKNSQQKQAAQLCSSAPPKLSGNLEINEKAGSADKIIAIEKSNQVVVSTDQPSEVMDQNERVHIPEFFEDSDADSETLSDKPRRIDAYNEVGQSSKQPSGKGGHQVWRMEMDKQQEDGSIHAMLKEQSLQKNQVVATEPLNSEALHAPADQLGDGDNVFNSQESVLTYDGRVKDMVVEVDEDAGKIIQDDDLPKDV
jgi:hypothetical protein